jgi:hypothetical protein
MKRLALLAGLALAFPVAASHGNSFVHATLTGYQEVPAVSTQADGIFEARISSDGSSVEWALVYEGLQADVTQAHIHFAQAFVNGPIVVWLCGSATTPGPSGTQTCPVRGGTVRGTFNASNVLASPTTQQLAAGELAEVIRAMSAGAAYVNVHTTVSGGGEIRGQIHRGPAHGRR